MDQINANNLPARVRDNVERRRFELEIDGATAVAEYRLDGGVITFTHTETPPALQGRGVAAALVMGALTSARERRLKVQATCSYVAAYLKRHPEFLDSPG